MPPPRDEDAGVQIADLRCDRKVRPHAAGHLRLLLRPFRIEDPLDAIQTPRQADQGFITIASVIAVLFTWATCARGNGGGQIGRPGPHRLRGELGPRPRCIRMLKALVRVFALLARQARERQAPGRAIPLPTLRVGLTGTAALLEADVGAAEIGRSEDGIPARERNLRARSSAVILSPEVRAVRADPTIAERRRAIAVARTRSASGESLLLRGIGWVFEADVPRIGRLYAEGDHGSSLGQADGAGDEVRPGDDHALPGAPMSRTICVGYAGPASAIDA